MNAVGITLPQGRVIMETAIGESYTEAIEVMWSLQIALPNKSFSAGV